MDPSGTFVQCDARAIGSASEGAQSSLQEVYHKVIEYSHNFYYYFINQGIIYIKWEDLKRSVLGVLGVHTLVTTT